MRSPLIEESMVWTLLTTYYEILKAAHIAKEANPSPKVDFFWTQLTVQGVVSPKPRPPVAYNFCVSSYAE